MKPEDISNAEFSLVSRGGYNTSEVDAFLQKAAGDFATLTKSEEELRRRMAKMLETIREYDKEKDHIYKTLVSAQTMADSKVSEATVQAEEIMTQAAAQAQQLLGEKRAEADAYYYEKTHTADERLKTLEAQISELEGKYSSALDEYIRLAQEKAAAIIQKANDDAAAIVAAAFEDAKKARSQADETVASAKSQLDILSKAVALFKGQVTSAVDSIVPAMKAIEVDAEFEVPKTEVAVTSVEDIQIPQFTFEPSKPVEAPDPETAVQATTEEVASSATFATPQTADNGLQSGESFFRPTAKPVIDGGFFDFSGDSAPKTFFYDIGSEEGDSTNAF